MGTVPLEGSYAITHNLVRLEIELGGTTPGSEHDQLASTGTVDLGGTLDVSLVDLSNGYAPTAGDQFEIVTSSVNGITGTFASENFPQFALDHVVTWQPISYSADKVVIEIASTTPYDVDLDDDGDVDGLDFLAIQRTDPSLIPAWEFEYGSALGANAEPQAVPEPACWLVVVGLVMVRCSTRLRK
ncbi:MAG: hypothetical protein ACR2NM_07485 [Bythopirellula sp.]